MIAFVLMLTVGAIMIAIGSIFGLSGPDAAMAGLVVVFLGLILVVTTVLVRLFRSMKHDEHKTLAQKSAPWHELR